MLSIGVVVLLGAGLRIGLLAARAFPFNSDEAIVGLMARHILRGEWSTFFYGQAYMGSLDATLVALGFRLFGERIGVIRAIQVLLVCGTIATSMILAWRVRPGLWSPLIAGLLVALPPVNVTLYTTVSLGGYGEALLLGNLILLLALDAVSRPSQPWRYALWGATAGLGFWAFGLTLVYSLPAAFLLGSALRGQARSLLVRTAGLTLLGVGLGSLPWWTYAAQHGLVGLTAELAGSAIAGASGPSWLVALPAHFLNLVLFGTTVIVGIRPPWGLVWLGGPFPPLALAFWAGVIYWTIRVREDEPGARRTLWLLKAVVATTVLGFIVTPFGADPSGRYFLPLAVPLSIFAARALQDWRPRLRPLAWAGLIALLPVFHLWGNVQSAATLPPGLTTQFDPIAQIDHAYDGELIDFLRAQGETTGYSNYWVAYPLAFETQEQLVFVPRLPYHQDLRYTPRDDRYPPYDAVVAASPRAAYITTRAPALDARLRAGLAARGVTWQERRIGDYQIFYRLSAHVTPDELLGGT